MHALESVETVDKWLLRMFVYTACIPKKCMSEGGTERNKLHGMGSLVWNACMADGQSVQNLGWLGASYFCSMPCGQL